MGRDALNELVVLLPLLLHHGKGITLPGVPNLEDGARWLEPLHSLQEASPYIFIRRFGSKHGMRGDVLFEELLHALG
uniref:Putative secreted protein n=1 Tax=Ixodes ricinus TaxID=34613 RepID=A0A6B0U4R3_IXORI